VRDAELRREIATDGHAPNSTAPIPSGIWTPGTTHFRCGHRRSCFSLRTIAYTCGDCDNLSPDSMKRPKANRRRFLALGAGLAGLSACKKEVPSEIGEGVRPYGERSPYERAARDVRESKTPGQVRRARRSRISTE